MANDKFSIKESLSYGWDTFKANVPFFIGLMVVMAVITIVPDAIAERMLEPKSGGLLAVKLVLRLIGLILGMITTRISLDIYDHGKPDLSRVGEIVPQIPSYLVGKIIYGLMVLVGLILLIVPGIIVAYMFLYVGYLIIDRNIGPIAAIQESRVLTDGYKMDLFLFSLAVAGINLVGVICLFVGLFVTIPTTLMASVYVYRKLAPADAVETVAEAV